MRTTLLVIAALLAFVATLLWRAPASWLGRALPTDAQCASLGGTIWTGQCAQLRVRGTEVGDLSWQLHPLPLLGGRLLLDAALAGRELQLGGLIELQRSGRLAVSGLTGHFPSRALGLPLPEGAQGAVQLDGVGLVLESNRLATLQGTAELRGLQLQDGTALGSYQLQFPAEGASQPPFRGRLRDRDGPVAVDAAVSVQPNLAWEVNGSVSARAGADPQLAGVLDLVGPADARGARALSAAGTF